MSGRRFWPSAPTASAAAIHAQHCAISSKSTASTLPSRRSRHWWRAGTWIGKSWATPLSVIKSTPDARRHGRCDESRMNTLIDIAVPDIGDFKNIPVIEILVKAGDRVAKDAPLVVLESDNATLDVP